MGEGPRLFEYRVVLIAPLYSGNVGSIARLAMNFDVRDVVLVAPQCDPLDGEAQKFACKLSQEMLRSFRVVSELNEAISDCDVVVGFSRRTGEFRSADVDIDSIPLLNQGGRVALVFGREDNGISRDEILRCTHVCAIPSSPHCPSLNLSHSVAVVLSRLFSFVGGTQKISDIQAHRSEPISMGADALVTAAQFEEFIEHWRETLVAVGLTEAGNPERMMPHLRRIFQKARLSDKELRLIRGILGNTLAATGAREKRVSSKQPATKT